MNLHLFIPSLFWSDLTTPEIYNDLRLPSLEKLLARSTVTRTPTSDFDAWLCQAFSIKKQLDWPVAPITLQTEHSNPAIAQSEQYYWLRADPVHLRIEQNHIMLADNHIFKLTQNEALQYTHAINQHLADDALTLFPLHPHRWYMRLTNRPEIQTNTLRSVTCKNINNHLPIGKDSVRWHTIFNEIQMLLHDHPLNQQREITNQMTINSIWFWGGGNLPESGHSPYSNVWSNEHFSHALARLCKIPHDTLPNNPARWLQENNTGNQLIILDTLLPSDTYNTMSSWREDLEKLEKSWFMPLYIALRNNQIDRLKISTINENANYDFVITRNSLRKFWLTIKPLSHFAVKQSGA